jgi:streptogramin lyase
MVASDGRGVIWLASASSNMLLRMDTRTGTSQPLALANPNPGIQDILVDQTGKLWYLSIGGSRLGVVE